MIRLLVLAILLTFPLRANAEIKDFYCVGTSYNYVNGFGSTPETSNSSVVVVVDTTNETIDLEIWTKGRQKLDYSSNNSDTDPIIHAQYKYNPPFGVVGYEVINFNRYSGNMKLFFMTTDFTKGFDVFSGNCKLKEKLF